MSELLIVGGLTIDHFADGRSAPGGSVLHAGLAAVQEGVTPTFLAVAGDEPEAREGLARLAALGELIHQPAPATTTYRHEEKAGRRVLVFEAATASIDPAVGRRAAIPRVALFAPIAGELSAAAVDELRRDLRPERSVLLIQGWLRRLEIGSPVLPLPLDAVATDLWVTFAAADAIVVSTEDLAEAPENPFAQAAALRTRIGPGPILVLTLGAAGHLLDDPGTDRLVATMPRRVVEGVPTVGAGDIFGAALAIHLSRGEDATSAAEAATERVIRMLEARPS
ncbi:MAG: PfkB family carbohydrate kinase [Candidatus Limnocylindria bacterium]